jgi:hypothetical protein
VPCSGSVQVVRPRLTFAKTRVHSSNNPHVTCGGRNDTGAGLSASTSVWFCQCYSANGPYLVICHRCCGILVIKNFVK